MDRFEQQLKDFHQAARRLEEALDRAANVRDTELYPFLRDSSIQRFEFTFEIFWKLVKTAMRVIEGEDCHSPKSCMRALFHNGYVRGDDLENLFVMVDDRNLTVHTYRESLAEELFGKLPDHLALMKRVISEIEKKGHMPR